MTLMRRLSVALVFLLAVHAPAGAAERILLFISDVVVERNSGLLVAETIRVETEGQNIRRGILRDFPTTYTRNDGSRVEVGFTVQSVTRDGRPENWSTENLSNGVRIRIGSPDVTLTNGPHTYVITYRTSRQIGFFQDYDELYWNATGTGWDFAIDQAEARITLPTNVPFRQSAFYTGPQGARGQDATVVEQQPGRIVFRTTQPLPVHNGLTVAAAWEKGVIEPPSTAQKATYFLQDNGVIAAAYAGLVLVLLYYGFAWMSVGRDPPSGTIIPLFAPPEGMSPSATRFVDHMGFDDRCFAAAVIDLGVNGHLKIVGSGKTSTIEQRTGGGMVTAEKSAMESKLFQNGSAIELVQSNHVQLGYAKSALKDTLKNVYVGTLFKNNYGWSSLGLVLTILLYVGVVTVAAVLNRNDLVAALAVVGFMAMPFVMGGAAMLFVGYQRAFGGGWLMIWGALVLAIGVIGGLWLITVVANGPVGLLPAIALFIAAAVSGIGFYLLKAPSPAGRKVMDDIEGFRQYLGVAEEERLNSLNPPNKTPELFERFLPYAVALDVQNAWAKRFAGVLAAAGTAAVAHSWYESDRRWDDPVSFADHLGSELTQAIATASTAPGSSSGSSGGGSSGGGGGGGGGSGW